MKHFSAIVCFKMSGSKGLPVTNRQNCLRLRSQVAPGIDKFAKCVPKNPNSLRSNKRIFFSQRNFADSRSN